MKLIDADEIRWVDHYDSDGNLSKYKVAFSDEMPPTVDAVPVRHGHWVGIDDEPCEVWECDVCGYIYETDGKLHRYCPNCGADMRGEQDE